MKKNTHRSFIGVPFPGFVAFVLSLGSRSLYGYQFSQFGYCHMALLVVVGQSTMLAANVFSGFIWCAFYIAWVLLFRDRCVHCVAQVRHSLRNGRVQRHLCLFRRILLRKDGELLCVSASCCFKCCYACVRVCISDQPLIKLSPKKTWEGFIGGFIATIIWSFWVRILCVHVSL